MTEREFRTRLARRARKTGLDVPDELASRLWTYFELLVRWNRKINLTALDLDAPDTGIDRLLIEPLIAARLLPGPALRVMDIGSGGGSPSIPMKLAAPSAALVMVEAKARKSAFLREVVRVLDLPDAHVENSRFEQLLARPDLHEAMDVVTIRAVRVESRTLQSVQAFLKPEGRMFLFGGGSSDRDSVPPTLQVASSHPLSADDPGNRLVILRKRSIGRAR